MGPLCRGLQGAGYSWRGGPLGTYVAAKASSCKQAYPAACRELPLSRGTNVPCTGHEPSATLLASAGMLRGGPEGWREPQGNCRGNAGLEVSLRRILPTTAMQRPRWKPLKSKDWGTSRMLEAFSWYGDQLFPEIKVLDPTLGRRMS